MLGETVISTGGGSGAASSTSPFACHALTLSDRLPWQCMAQIEGLVDSLARINEGSPPGPGREKFLRVLGP
eukprot:6009995-Amphidinium_carterae.1